MTGDWLEFLANVATVLTAAVAVIAYGGYRIGRKRRQWALEGHLKSLKAEVSKSKFLDHEPGEQSALRLMAELKFSEAEVLQAAFDSPRIITRLGTDNLAVAIFFRYREKNRSPRSSSALGAGSPNVPRPRKASSGENSG